MATANKSPLKILLWSFKGAGPDYHGPGMNAWRLYSKLQPDHGVVRLLHANPDQRVIATDPWRDSVCFAGSNSKRLQYVRTVSSVVAYLKSNRTEFDVVHVLAGFYPSIVVALAAEKLGIPSVVKIAANGTEIRSKIGIRTLHRKLRYFAMKKVSAFIAISAEIAEGLSALGISDNRIHYIPNGVDTNLFIPREKLSKNELSKKILFSGALVRRKRPHLLLSAIPYLQEHHNVEVIFAGPAHDKSYFDELKAIASDSGIADRVFWCGFVDDMPDLLRSVDAICLPSAGEGMANAILEAMASGIPFVVTPCSGMEELAASGGGLITEAEPKEIAKALQYVMDFSASFGVKGRRAALNRYSTEKVLQDHLSLFSTLKRKA